MNNKLLDDIIFAQNYTRYKLNTTNICIYKQFDLGVNALLVPTF